MPTPFRPGVRSLLVPLVVAAAVLGQGPASLVKDINLTTASGASGLTANPSEAFTVRGFAWFKTYFVATDPMHGTELWLTDGTPAGTVLVKDIAPGTASSSPSQFIQLNDFLVFTADDGARGRELWRSDGTAAGTYLVSDINPGSASSSPSSLTYTYGNAIPSTERIFFSADNGTLGRELWYTNGTGATLAVDANPGSGSGMTMTAPIVRRVDPSAVQSVYFAATNGAAGVELWQFGSSGAHMCAEIRPGASGSAPADIFVHSPSATASVLFSANDGTHGREVWSVTPAAVGADPTTMVVDVNPGAASSSPSGFSRWQEGSDYVFSAEHPTYGRELWIGPLAGGRHTLLMDINPGVADSSPVVLGTVGALPFGTVRTLLAATTATHGRELWRSLDRSAVLDLDINPGPASSSPGSYRFVYFAATDPTHGRELWYVHPLFGTVTFFADIRPGAASANPETLEASGAPFLVAADDGVHGREPWTANPATATAALLKDINPDLTHGHPREFAALGDLSTMLFQGNDGMTGAELWRSDGTAAGTVLVKDIHPGTNGSSPRTLTAWNGRVWFVADDGSTGPELWSSDGTTSGTTLVKDIEPGPGGFVGQELVAFAGSLWFAASDGPGGSQLWRTDGTTAGTVLVKVVNPAGSALPKGFAVVGSTLFFSAFTAAQGVELWRSDGTTAGTVLVKDINPGSAGSTLSLFGHAKVAFGSLLVFAASNGVSGDELWRSDGTSTGTTLVLDINPGAADSAPYELTAAGSVLYFTAMTAATGLELWRSNLLPGGTTLVRDIQPGAPGSAPRSLTMLGSTLLFAAETPSAGRELWRSDGTVAGTVLVKDIYAGPQDGVFDTSGLFQPRVPFFTLSGAQRAVFVASDGLSGAEVWRTDGTAAGTVRHTDLALDAAGSLSDSYPTRFALAGSKVFFAANDGVLGYELYAMTAMASFMTFGQGCPGTGNLIPQVDGSGVPALGNSTFAVTCGNARPNSPALLELAFGPLDLPVGNGCRILVDLLGPFLTLGGTTNARGDARLPLPIPDDRSLEGLQLFAQCLVLDPQGAFLQTLAFSDGLRVVVGR